MRMVGLTEIVANRLHRSIWQNRTFTEDRWDQISSGNSYYGTKCHGISKSDSISDSDGDDRRRIFKTVDGIDIYV